MYTLIADEDATETLVATLTPAYHENGEFAVTTENSAIVDQTSGVVQKVSNTTGKSIVTATAGGKSASADIYVIKSELAQTAYTYDGTEKKPAVTVTCGSSALTLGNDYTVDYYDCTNGWEQLRQLLQERVTYTGYTKTLEYTIAAATFDQATVDAATFGIDISSGTVTSAIVGSLTMDVDFVASAIQTGVSAGGNPVYDITVTGIGNYAGTELKRTNYKVTASASSAIDISSSGGCNSSIYKCCV